MMDISERNRLEYLDFLKGLAILFVVMGHFLAWTFPPDIVRGQNAMFVKEFIYSFHMPLFFFISGYLADRSNKTWKLSFCVDLLKRRFLSLIVPGISFFLLLYVRTGSFYFEWFVRALFEIYVLFALVKLLITAFAPNKFYIELAGLLGVFVILCIADKMCGEGVLRSYFFSVRYWYIYFVFGCLYYKFDFDKYILKKNWIYSLSLFAFFGLFFLKYTNVLWHHKLDFFPAFAAIIVLMRIAQYVNYETPNIVTKMLLKWGRISLSIYLLSPLFIPSFPDLGMLFIRADLYEPYGNITHSHHVTTIFLQMIFGLVVSVPVCMICQGVKELVSKSSFFNALLFGEYLKKRKSESCKKDS